MKVNEQQIKAIERLRQDEDFRIFMGGVAEYAEELTHKLIYCDADKMPLIQGMTRGVVDILKTANEAKIQ